MKQDSLLHGRKGIDSFDVWTVHIYRFSLQVRICDADYDARSAAPRDNQLGWPLSTKSPAGLVFPNVVTYLFTSVQCCRAVIIA
jgi:hypothetical protein